MDVVSGLPWCPTRLEPKTSGVLVVSHPPRPVSNLHTGFGSGLLRWRVCRPGWWEDEGPSLFVSERPGTGRYVSTTGSAGC